MKVRAPRRRRRLERPVTPEERAERDQERAAIDADPIMQHLRAAVELLRARPHPPGRRPGGDEGD